MSLKENRPGPREPRRNGAIEKLQGELRHRKNALLHILDQLGDEPAVDENGDESPGAEARFLRSVLPSGFLPASWNRAAPPPPLSSPPRLCGIQQASDSCRPADPDPRPASAETWCVAPAPSPAPAPGDGGGASPWQFTRPPSDAAFREQVVAELEGGALIRSRYHAVGKLSGKAGRIVVEAVDAQSQLRVAIQFMPPSRSKPAGALDSLRALSHPRIIRILDHGSAPGGGSCIVMPYVKGSSLERLIGWRRSGGPGPSAAREPRSLPGFSSRQVALLFGFRKVCEGVYHAHRHGIIHCDLKPDKILVDGAQGPVVVGWDRCVSAGDHPEMDPRSPSPVVGTPAYMAPEQFAGGFPTAAVDVYALGAILFELITSTRIAPHSPPDNPAQAVLNKFRQSPPLPSRSIDDLPRHLDAIVARCLDRDPAMRYRDAGELLEDLENAGE